MKEPSGLLVTASDDGHIVAAVPLGIAEGEHAPEVVKTSAFGQTTFEVALPPGSWSDEGLDLTGYRVDVERRTLAREGGEETGSE